MDSEVRRLILDAPLLICDFDGTLAHLNVDWEALKHRLHDAALGAGIPWAFQHGFDVDLRKIRKEISEPAFLSFCHMIAEAEVAGFKDAGVNTILIDALVARGSRPLAIFSSNTSEALSKILSHAPFRGIAAFIVGKEDVVEGKPDPEGIISIQQHFHLSGKDCLFIGDTDIDVESGKRGGVRTVKVHSFH
jgi:phosphoglycolate phosphatase